VTDTRPGRWESAAEWPLTAAAVAFLAAYAWPILNPTIGRGWHDLCNTVQLLTWGLFVADYLTRLTLAPDRRDFFRRNIIGLVVIALPLLRPLRLLRLLSLLNVLNRYAGDSLRGRVTVYVTGSTVMVLFVASLTVLEAERPNPDANITTFGDALWWAVTTVTTVGYGDHYPVTTTGRLVAVGLMLTGIALLGIVTASLATWLLDGVRAVEQEAQAETRDDIGALAQEVAALRRELAEARGVAPGHENDPAERDS